MLLQDTAQLFSVSNELFGKFRTTHLPSDVPRSELPQRFCNFFSSKISNLRDDLDSRSCDGPLLFHFDRVTEKICELIVGSSTKSGMLDPIPTSLIKQCLNDLVPLVTAIINVSLSTGTVPKQFKQAVVTPLLKKPGLDTNDLKHFRPVSNLPFITKVLEKIVQRQLQKHLSDKSFRNASVCLQKGS